MRRKGVLAAAVILAALTAAVLITRGRMPYQDLKASEVVSAAVRYPRRMRPCRSQIRRSWSPF